MKTPLGQVALVLSERTMSKTFNEARFSKEVAAYLLTTGRTGQLNSLVRDMTKQWAQHGIIEVTVISAHELDAKVISDIKAKTRQLYPDAKKIIINNRYEKDLIGGVRIELPDFQLDLSLRSKLDRFKALTTIS
jgi:F0F1-type ATP synthase delta subunit